MYNGIINYLGNGLNRRSGVKLHVIVLHDSTDLTLNGCSAMGAYQQRQNLLNSHSNIEISVVRYADAAQGEGPGNVHENANAMSAAHATMGGDWDCASTQCFSLIEYNPFDPNPSEGPRRHYYFPDIQAQTLTDLAQDVLTTCQLRITNSCGQSGFGVQSIEWQASNGGAISGSNTTNIITTNGQGTYTATVTLENNCQIVKVFNY